MATKLLLDVERLDDEVRRAIKIARYESDANERNYQSIRSFLLKEIATAQAKCRHPETDPLSGACVLCGKLTGTPP